ncbi:unnamed protein product [Citrullus colocynthis]|uniref:Transposase n=1 Tax=Citrullus colocynthis TaxID=252529 RepID=A0ABP0Y9T8_9ROSI
MVPEYVSGRSNFRDIPALFVSQKLSGLNFTESNCNRALQEDRSTSLLTRFLIQIECSGHYQIESAFSILKFLLLSQRCKVGFIHLSGLYSDVIMEGNARHFSQVVATRKRRDAFEGYVDKF